MWVAALPGLSALRGSATRGWWASPEKTACEGRPVVQATSSRLYICNYYLHIGSFWRLSQLARLTLRKSQLEKHWRVEAPAAGFLMEPPRWTAHDPLSAQAHAGAGASGTGEHKRAAAVPLRIGSVG